MTQNIGKGLRILVLDDEKDACEFSKKFFERRGFEVYTAMTGKAALDILKKTNINIALLDIHLYKGKTSGIDVLKVIREKQPLCQCVMLTRDDHVEMINETKKMGAVYLVKPLTLEKIEDAIAKAVNKLGKGGR